MEIFYHHSSSTLLNNMPSGRFKNKRNVWDEWDTAAVYDDNVNIFGRQHKHHKEKYRISLRG
jgi:hypothetical protein